jgi:hypothetical protein
MVMLKIFYPKEFYKRVEDINLNLDKYISYEGIILIIH